MNKRDRPPSHVTSFDSVTERLDRLEVQVGLLLQVAAKVREALVEVVKAGVVEDDILRLLAERLDELEEER